MDIEQPLTVSDTGLVVYTTQHKVFGEDYKDLCPSFDEGVLVIPRNGTDGDFY